MTDGGFDLVAAAHQEMIDQGFDPDFSPEVGEQLAALKTQTVSSTGAGVRDLRSLLWSSIDNAPPGIWTRPKWPSASAVEFGF